MPTGRLQGIKAAGVDYLSTDEYNTRDYPTHHILLEAGVVIVGGFDLTGVPLGITSFSACCSGSRIPTAPRDACF